MELTHDTVKSLGGPLYEVWNSIGYDSMEACQICGEEMDTEMVIEACIDADHITYFVHGERGIAAQTLVRALFAEHGYHTVIKFLAKQFPMGY